jgi:Rhodopirellula transposase DDE domain
VLAAEVAPETAGNPMTEQKWLRGSLRRLSQRLRTRGQRASPPTVRRLLKKHKYTLKVNRKTKETGQGHPDRETQFAYSETQKQAAREKGLPMISVDTKKKELIGDFKNAGAAWCQEPEVVNTHDFPHDALGRAVPYGIYDLQHNRGSVYVGTSADTPQFAVAAIARWWETEGRATYPHADRLQIFADAGGSNGCRPRAWKHALQTQLADRFGLHVTVCHYPTGCSKWNPIEHRLFSYISLNWAGKPLRTLAILLAYLRGTMTATGLTVSATLLEGAFPLGQRISKQEMAALHLELHATCPRWNDTLHPRLPLALCA